MKVEHLNEGMNQPIIVQLDGGRSLTVEVWRNETNRWGDTSIMVSVSTKDSVSDDEIKKALIKEFDSPWGFISVRKDNVNTTEEYSVWNISITLAD